jgi:hypothetical protein
MKITLKNGKEAEVWVSYGKEKFRDENDKIVSGQWVRLTTVNLKLEDEEYQGVSRCVPTDNFDPREGKKLAYRQLVQTVRLSRKDRKKVFETICPKLCSPRPSDKTKLKEIKRKLTSKNKPKKLLRWLKEYLHVSTSDS